MSFTDRMNELAGSLDDPNSKYIVFEGTDGSGKTTIARAVFDALPGNKIFTKEPGSPHMDFTLKIRELVLHGTEQAIDPITYAYLFAADTFEHMRQVVIPSLQKGHWVVSDRSVMSDYAYRPHDGDHIRMHNFFLFEQLNPKIFFIDTEAKTCEERLNGRGEPLNEFEKAHVMNKITTIRLAYLSHSLTKITANEYRRVYTVDNNHLVDDAIDAVKSALTIHFEELRGLPGFKQAANHYFN